MNKSTQTEKIYKLKWNVHNDMKLGKILDNIKPFVVIHDGVCEISKIIKEINRKYDYGLKPCFFQTTKNENEIKVHVNNY